MVFSCYKIKPQDLQLGRHVLTVNSESGRSLEILARRAANKAQREERRRRKVEQRKLRRMYDFVLRACYLCDYMCMKRMWKIRHRPT